jgi:DnaK suppressor protein
MRIDANEMRRVLMDRRGVVLRRWHEDERDESELLSERAIEREDLATEQALATAVHAQREVDLRSLEQIAAAILRLDADTYGTCVDCQKPIGAERLRARPETPCCTGCAEAREAGEEARR